MRNNEREKPLSDVGQYQRPNKDAWDDTIALIEFKYRNLMEKPNATASKSVRKELAHSLCNAIGEALGKCADRLDPMVMIQLEEELADEVEKCVRECLGKPRGIRGQGKARNKGSILLEEVKTKAGFSALLLQIVLDKPIEYVRNHVDFVLVYDPQKNSGADDVQEIRDCRAVPSSGAIGSFHRMLAKSAGRPAARFGLKKSIGAFFHDVLTLTPDEMLAYIRCLA